MVEPCKGRDLKAFASELTAGLDNSLNLYGRTRFGSAFFHESNRNVLPEAISMEWEKPAGGKEPRLECGEIYR